MIKRILKSYLNDLKLDICLVCPNSMIIFAITTYLANKHIV